MTPLQLLVKQWTGCTRCYLHETRKKIVFARGDVPSDVVFVGEAPGESEDVRGLPFIGPAGKLFDQIIARSVGRVRLCSACGYLTGEDHEKTPCTGTDAPRLVRYSLTNLVMCIPRDETGSKTEEPADECVQACRPRLEKYLTITKPKLIITVGKEAHGYLRQGYKNSLKIPDGVPVVHVDHPAYILRQHTASRMFLAERVMVTLQDAIREVFGTDPERVTPLTGLNDEPPPF